MGESQYTDLKQEGNSMSLYRDTCSEKQYSCKEKVKGVELPCKLSKEASLGYYRSYLKEVLE